jgi:hypothetical protein
MVIHQATTMIQQVAFVSWNALLVLGSAPEIFASVSETRSEREYSELDVDRARVNREPGCIPYGSFAECEAQPNPVK